MNNHDYLWLLLMLPVFVSGFAIGWLTRSNGARCPACGGWLEHEVKDGEYFVRLPRQCRTKQECLAALTEKESTP